MHCCNILPQDHTGPIIRKKKGDWEDWNRQSRLTKLNNHGKVLSKSYGQEANDHSDLVPEILWADGSSPTIWVKHTHTVVHLIFKKEIQRKKKQTNTKHLWEIPFSGLMKPKLTLVTQPLQDWVSHNSVVAQSTDLNVIEHLWRDLKMSVHQQPQSTPAACQTLQRIISEYSQIQWQNSVCHFSFWGTDECRLNSGYLNLFLILAWSRNIRESENILIGLKTFQHCWYFKGDKRKLSLRETPETFVVALTV